MTGEPLDFDGCLEYSHGAAGEPAWCEVYRKAWPGCELTDMRHPGEHQRRGVDRMARRPNGTMAFIDEKVRDREYEGDVLLELWSIWERHVPGWLTDNHKQNTHLAALYLRDQWCILLPTDELTRGWQANAARWKQYACAGLDDFGGWINSGADRMRHRGDRGFALVKTATRREGRRWQTLSIAVPERHLFGAMEDAMRIGWQSLGEES